MTKTKKSVVQKTSSLFLFFLASLAQTTAFAEIDLTGLYSGAIFSNASYDLKLNGGGKQTESWGHFKGKLGKSINEYIDAEGQLGLTSNTGKRQGVITYGAYLRISKDMGQYKPYGLIGLAGYHVYEDGFNDQSEAGVSYGAGIEIFGSKDLSVTVEYLRLLDKSVDSGDLTFDTVGIGFTYYFTEDKSYFHKNSNKIRSIRY